MAQRSNPDNDPHPWVTVDYDGKEYRVQTAHEDDSDEQSRLWEGWVYAPRTREQLKQAGY